VELYLYYLYIPSPRVWGKLYILPYKFTDLQGKFFPPAVHGITVIWECPYCLYIRHKGVLSDRQYITVGGWDNIHRYEGFQGVPDRPTGKGMLEARWSAGKRIRSGDEKGAVVSI